MSSEGSDDFSSDDGEGYMENEFNEQVEAGEKYTEFGSENRDNTQVKPAVDIYKTIQIAIHHCASLSELSKNSKCGEKILLEHINNVLKSGENESYLIDSIKLVSYNVSMCYFILTVIRISIPAVLLLISMA